MNLHLSAHRHFLILPVFLFLLLISLFGASSSQNASIMRQTDPKIERFPAVISWGVHAQAMVWSDTLVDRAGSVPRLLSGPLLVKTDGIVEMDVADLHLTGMNGGTYVTVRGGVVTVAALTTSMLATSGQRSVLIPAGLQWSGNGRIASYDAGVTQWAKSRALSAVPATFKRTQLMQLESFPTVSLPTGSVDFSPGRFFSFAFNGWRLPAAQQRVDRLYEEEVFRELTRCIQEGDRECVMEILHDADNEEDLSDQRGQGILASLLSQISGDSVMTNMLLTALMRDDRFWLLATIHPQWRLHAWGVDHPTPSTEMRMLHLFVLPQSDVWVDALPIVILRRWEQEAADLLTLDADPRSLLNHLVSVLVPIVHTETILGYPERARILATSLTNIVVEYKELLSSTASVAVQSLSQPGDEPFDVITHDLEAAASSSERSMQSFDPERVVGLAEELLRESGAAFTVQTSFEALDASRVRVTKIVFSGVHGDLSYDFLLDTVQRTVSGVVVGGRPLPNELSLQEFVRWARLR
ncbi:MAG: hypothetical protein PHH13_03940 [Candidatus Peribacteraceae bacterium]|nr:hypothetical protein [Candidatus Peribacteraceae bacterium]